MFNRSDSNIINDMLDKYYKHKIVADVGDRVLGAALNGPDRDLAAENLKGLHLDNMRKRAELGLPLDDDFLDEQSSSPAAAGALLGGVGGVLNQISSPYPGRPSFVRSAKFPDVPGFLKGMHGDATNILTQLKGSLKNASPHNPIGAAARFFSRR